MEPNQEYLEDRAKQIRAWEDEADALVGESCSLRAQAAGAMVELVEAGHSQREVGRKIGKSEKHVRKCIEAWHAMAAVGDKAKPMSFQEFYRAAGKRKPSSADPGPQQNPVVNPHEGPVRSDSSVTGPDVYEPKRKRMSALDWVRTLEYLAGSIPDDLDDAQKELADECVAELLSSDRLKA
jgi:hypothetical protein